MLKEISHGFVLETPRRGRQQRKARSPKSAVFEYFTTPGPEFVLFPPKKTDFGFVHLLGVKRGVEVQCTKPGSCTMGNEP